MTAEETLFNNLGPMPTGELQLHGHEREIENEGMIAKINAISALESISPYPRTTGPTWGRFERALRYFPERYRIGGLRLFSSIVYVGQNTLDQTWRYLAAEADRGFGLNERNMLDDAFLFAEDPVNLKAFVHWNQIKGRLDTDRHPRSISPGEVAKDLLIIELIKVLRQFDEKGRATKELPAEDQIYPLLDRKYWVLLVDNALSGKSLDSELKKLEDVAGSFSVSPKIIVLAQIVTDEAMRMVETKHKGIEKILYALRLGDGFSVNNEKCELLSASARESVLELCRWFYESTLKKDPEYEKSIALSGGDMIFGFMNSGLTLVTPNCPSNSLPPLWYQKSEGYEGPYPRVESRITQAKSKEHDTIAILKRLRRVSSSEGGSTP